LLDDYRIVKKIEVQWRDMDAGLHVNNVVYLKWTESARISYFLDLNNGRYTQKEDIGPVLAWQEIKYIRPVSFPDTVLVGIDRSEILDDRIVLEAKVYSVTQDRIVAVSHQHIVPYDYKRRMKVPLPLTWVYNE